MRVTQTTLLRAAAVLILLFAVGHMLGAANSWSPPGETETLTAMREFTFEVGGSRRTYWDFYYGFGVYIGVLLLLQSVLVWQLASLHGSGVGVATVRPLIVPMVVAWMAGTAVLWVYIFIVPATISTLCTACLLSALIARPLAPG